MVPPAPVAARKLAARTNENARLRQQLEAAATVIATLHHRRENIGRNGRSRRLVTRGRQDAARVRIGVRVATTTDHHRAARQHRHCERCQVICLGPPRGQRDRVDQDTRGRQYFAERLGEADDGGLRR